MHSKHGIGQYVTLVPVAQAPVQYQALQPQALSSVAQAPAASSQLQQAQASAVPPQNAYMMYVPASRPELSPKMSLGELESFLIEARRELQETRMDLSKAEALLRSDFKELQSLLADWRSSRASLETRLTSTEMEKLLDIATRDQQGDPEEKRERLQDEFKSRIDRNQRTLDLSVLRVRTLKKMLHSLQAEIEDAEFLVEHKRSLERVGTEKPSTTGPAGAGVGLPR
jgi:hypothetical protein